MRMRLTFLLLIIAICLTSCASPEPELSSEDVRSKFNHETGQFETVAEIFSAVPELREYLRDELHLENIFFSGTGMAHDGEVYLRFIPSDKLELAESACRSIAPSYVAYTALNIYDKSGSTRPVEAIEFSFALADSKYPENSMCSIFYVPSGADREFIAENPYRFYCGTTLRLNALDKEGWYIFVPQ